MGFLSWNLGRRGVKASTWPYPFSSYDPARRVLAEPYEPYMGSGGIFPVADPGYALLTGQRSTVEAVWRSQPNVRKVVDFVARNVASIPIHAFDRVSDTDRRRLTDHPLADVIRQPRSRMSAYRFWHSVLSDGLLYDRWAVLKQPRGDGRGLELVQVPSWRLWFRVDALKRVESVWYWVGDQERVADDRDGWRELPLESLIFNYGYAPSTAGLSPIETLADMLAETAEAVAYRRQVWKNGARVPAYIRRERDPIGQEWSPQARQRFADGFRAAYTGDGPNAGGVPVLEDGMTLNALTAFSPHDAMDLEGRTLSAIETAAAFHIAPELVGARQGNYSNVREYRQMLYRDSLGPYITDWEGVLNAQLVPDLADGRVLYVEANVEAKLRGSFEEQAQMMSSAIGAPWLTRDEGRALMNRSPIEGGDQLVVPLNVITGGQASPRDSGSSQKSRAASEPARRVKAAPAEPHVDRTEAVLSAFFKRQAQVVKSRLGANDAEWWDGERWDRELADDLMRLANMVTKSVAAETLDAIGFGPDAYDAERTLAFLKAVSERVAGSVNATTLAQVEAALVDLDDPGAAVDRVFEVAETSRAKKSALTVTTTFAGFATVEAAKQAAGGRATKTWVVNSGNPRASHAAMNGETVPVSENFSNGMPWPGSISGDVDEVAGCQCSLEINV
jgi:HK97 family phage portal protein